MAGQDSSSGRPRVDEDPTTGRLPYGNVIPASPRETSLSPLGTESLERKNTSPIGKGAGDIEEIVPDAQGHQGQQNVPRDTESPRDAASSPREAVRDNPQAAASGKSLGKSLGNVKTSPESLEASLGTFAEEIKELKKTMQLVRDSPREDRPAVSELMDKELNQRSSEEERIFLKEARDRWHNVLIHSAFGRLIVRANESVRHASFSDKEGRLFHQLR